MSQVDNKQLLGWVISQQHKQLEDVERVSKRFDRERRASIEATREELLSFASKASYMKRQRQKEIERITRLKRWGIFALILSVPVAVVFSLAYYLYQGSNLAKLAGEYFGSDGSEIAQMQQSEAGLIGLSLQPRDFSLSLSDPFVDPRVVSVDSGDDETTDDKQPLVVSKKELVRNTAKEVKRGSDLASVYPLPPLGVPAAPAKRPVKDESKGSRLVEKEPAVASSQASGSIKFKQAERPIDIKTLKPGDYIAPAGAKDAQSERVLSVFGNGDVLTDLRMIDANKVKFFEIRG